MKLSQVKIEAVKEISKYTSKKEAASFFFPMLRYHDRWKELDTKDFREAFANNPDPNFGFLMIGGVSSEAPRGTGFNMVGVEDVCTKSSELHLRKMAELCQQKGIRLILIKTPYSGWTEGMYTQAMEVADSLELDFWDYNGREILEGLGLHDPLMYSDKNHMNLFGAEKFTADISKRLLETGLLNEEQKPEAAEFFASLQGEYYYNLETKQLPFMAGENSDIFFAALNRNKKNYTIILLGCAEAFAFTDEVTKEQLSSLGFDSAFQTKENEGYVAMYENGILKVMEHSAEKLCIEGVLDGGEPFSLEVNGLNEGGYSKVSVGDNTKEFVDGGINFYIYDNKNHEFVCTETMY